jgi:hypothetical protein
MPPFDCVKLVSFNRGDVSDRAPGSFAQSGTLIGNASVSGGVLVLDGSGDYASYPDAAHLSLPSAFSVSVWFEPSTPGSVYRTPVSKFNSIGNQRTFYVSAGYGVNSWAAVLSATGASASGANAIQYTFAQTIPTSGWHHMIAVFDTFASAGNRAKLWIDGVQLSSTVTYDHSNFTPYDSTADFQIGSLGNTLSWKGNLDDCRLITRALSSAEVGAIYSAGRQ